MSGSGDIGPGDAVECVDASLGYVWGTPGLVAGRIYRVTEVRNYVGVDACPKCGTAIGLRIAGFDLHGWCIHRFKPIGGDHSSISELIRENAPATPERVTA